MLRDFYYTYTFTNSLTFITQVSPQQPCEEGIILIVISVFQIRKLRFHVSLIIRARPHSMLMLDPGFKLRLSLSKSWVHYLTDNAPQNSTVANRFI